MSNYIKTYTGAIFDYKDIPGSLIYIEDIAHALANQCRWMGHTRVFYSVAQHSVLASTYVPPEFRLATLLHDAAEAYLVDMARPIKELLPDYRRIESEIERRICREFNLAYPILNSKEIKTVDNGMLKAEWEQLTSQPTDITLQLPEDHWYPKDHIEPWEPKQAEEEFLIAYEDYREVFND